MPGIGGVLVFIPQIAILFGIVAFLEDSGYMARVIFISDKIMRRFGLSGRSVVPLFSGLACAVPAIMAARTIENKRERLITILVTPFMSCSARLPVFTVLTALAVPPVYYFGIVSLQGLVLFAMYMAGALFALGSAWLLKKLVAPQGRTVFMLELPWFKAPRWQAVAAEAYFKSRTFVVDAGKVILLISLVLWFLASFGPGKQMEMAEAKARQTAYINHANAQEIDAYAATAKLEASYAGLLGKAIEPAIRPLGFDWRIGISLIASFAAREVFVGTMATIHSVGKEFNDTSTLITRLRAAKDPETGLPSYRPSVAFSLMVFYLLAMQCMSTFAIVRRELNSWSWAIGQLVGMTTLAWLCSWGVYTLLN
jgi:ferrous iron transport protein B